MKGRQNKGWTQKELATKVCEKPQVITEYEQVGVFVGVEIVLISLTSAYMGLPVCQKVSSTQTVLPIILLDFFCAWGLYSIFRQ